MEYGLKTLTLQTNVSGLILTQGVRREGVRRDPDADSETQKLGKRKTLTKELSNILKLTVAEIIQKLSGLMVKR